MTQVLHYFVGAGGLQGSVWLSVYLEVLVNRVRGLSHSHMQQLICSPGLLNSEVCSLMWS